MPILTVKTKIKVTVN